MGRSSFNILFYANKGKEKNGIVPIMGRVTINGTQSQFSCKMSIPLTMWDVKGNCAKGRSIWYITASTTRVRPSQTRMILGETNR